MLRIIAFLSLIIGIKTTDIIDSGKKKTRTINQQYTLLVVEWLDYCSALGAQH